jgi:hypothetical protein
MRLWVERKLREEKDRMEDRINKIWPQDASNGYLSYTKMNDVTNRRHLRIKDPKTDEFKKIPICGSGGHTGSFIGKSTIPDIAVHCGIGISLYFKTLKQMIYLMFLLTILNYFTFRIYWDGRASNIMKDAKVFFSTFTLGNLGMSS